MSSKWWLVKSSYLGRSEEGQLKKIVEFNLFDGVSYTEVEAKAYDKLAFDGFEVNKIKETKLTDVIKFEDRIHWYKCFVEFTTINENNGKEKKIKEEMLIKADNLRMAFDSLNDRLKTVQLPSEIIKIEKTNIIEVYPHDPKADETEEAEEVQEVKVVEGDLQPPYDIVGDYTHGLGALWQDGDIEGVRNALVKLVDEDIEGMPHKVQMQIVGLIDIYKTKLNNYEREGSKETGEYKGSILQISEE